MSYLNTPFVKPILATSVVVLAGLTLSACAATLGGDNPTQSELVDTDSDGGSGSDIAMGCGDALYQRLVGQAIMEVHQPSLPRPHRIYGQHDMVTQDYRPERLNIVVDPQDRVHRVYCG
ncbi:I78 family peptidase inhibitor [Woodsholea maritima]|uniref:I78 family peptidase inhibitor n=1 Tax=Woodsholea maritima TaxID=240237 RepID=UPI00035C5C6B|nr:I78 family peptidase inhibitor [Woodsholea maritima]